MLTRPWLLLVALVACAPRAPARTLGRGHAEVATSVGGPLFGDLGITIPLPMASVGGRYGVGDRLDVIGHAQVAAAAYGVAGGDLGVTYQLYRATSVAVAATARASVFTDGSATRIYPEAAIVGDRRWGNRWSLIYGVTTLVQPSPPRDKPRAFVAFNAGAESRVGAGTLVIDLAWISPWEDSTSVVDWQVEHGAIVFRLGYRRGVL